ncbi:MAG: hypothetical protein KJ880_02990 [Candidatus Omnitrophica bacterium]|nr:hypothetical protein [Candidatus Omnitrophota bacterium]MBU1869775.1 hypothetical protein [Candidatus Omnitrophota bacterium]
MQKKIICAFIVVLFTPTILFAQIFRNSHNRNEIITRELAAFEEPGYYEEDDGYMDVNEQLNADFPGERARAMEDALRSVVIELVFEYMFNVHGQQTFEVVDSQGNRITKLLYPHRGNVNVFKGELRVSPRVSIGGKFGSSNFRKVTSTDTDWDSSVSTEYVWWESQSRLSPEVQFYDLNLYLTLFDLESQKAKSDPALRDFLNFLRVDDFICDIFGGYQQQKGRYRMNELVDTMEYWVPTNKAIGGLDSFYKVKYKGPRLGFRLKGSAGKVTTRLSFAYAWLTTKGYGWWNLRDYAFEHNSAKGTGRGIDVGLETTYNFTPNLSAGIGFNYLSCMQKSLTESGNQPGDVYNDLDIIRNVNSKIYGPSVLLRYSW